MAKLLFHVWRRPAGRRRKGPAGRQPTVASIARRAAAAALCCRYGLTLSAPVRCGGIRGGGGQQGADASYYPAGQRVSVSLL